MFKNNRLRLLMTLVGFERLGVDDTTDAAWIIPSTLTSTALQETHDIVQKHQINPVLTYGDDGLASAEDMLRRKSANRTHRAEFDDDSEGDGIVADGEEECFLFPAGGPTNRKSDALVELQKKRWKRRADHSDNEEGATLDEATRQARREARELADLAKRLKIKSEEFVHDSDDEVDEEKDREFFAREERLKREHDGKMLEAFRAARIDAEISNKSAKRKKRGGDAGDRDRAKRPRRHVDVRSESDENEEEEEEDDLLLPLSWSKHPSSSSSPRVQQLDSDLGDLDDDDDTPLSSPHVHVQSFSSLSSEPVVGKGKTFPPNRDEDKEMDIHRKPPTPILSNEDNDDDDDEDEDEDEQEVPLGKDKDIRRRRLRLRNTLLDDSDSDSEED